MNFVISTIKERPACITIGRRQRDLWIQFDLEVIYSQQMQAILR